MMIEVIEPAWLEFVAKIGKVSDVDDVLLIHQDFLEICLHNCMLKSPDLLRSVVKLCNICLNFCKFMQVSPETFTLTFFAIDFPIYFSNFSVNLNFLFDPCCAFINGLDVTCCRFCF